MGDIEELLASWKSENGEFSYKVVLSKDTEEDCDWPPLIELRTDEDVIPLEATEARQLAAHLIAAADKIDSGWGK